MESKFTWFPKLTSTVEMVPEEQRPALLWALARYGTYSEEPDLMWPLDAIFESLRDDIDNSKKAMENGRNGGRGNKKGASENGKGGFGNDETTLCGNENGGSEESEAKPNHTIPNHTIPNQEKSKRFAPPSVSEVREFCAEKGYAVDAEQFVAFYESKGWKVGRDPMKSWRAACTTWHKRHRYDQTGGGGSGDAYSAL